MTYTFTHQIQFRKSGQETMPYRTVRSWKTVRGALKAAELHAQGMEAYYEPGSIACHAIVIWDDQGRFVTNMAA